MIELLKRSALVLGLALLLGEGVARGQEVLLAPDAEVRFFRGTEEPSPAGAGGPTADWTQISFDDGLWEPGALGVGYEAGTDAVAEPLLNTLLDDMQNTYLSCYVRIPFMVDDTTTLNAVQFGIQYDDGYVAYLNGTEINRVGLTGMPPAFNVAATSKDITAAPEWTAVDKSLFVEGLNILAVQGHNTNLTSSDFSIVPQMRFFEDLCPLTLDCRVLPGNAERSDRVRLTWTTVLTPAPYERVDVLRNGQMIGEPSSPVSRVFTDETPPLGENTYEVVATVEGTPCAGEGVPSCTALVTNIGGGTTFRRGDADADGITNLTDGVFLLNFLFLNGPSPTCQDAADANDDGELNITTALYLFNFLFVNGPAIPEPGPAQCGPDTSQDPLDCVGYDGC